MPFNHSIKPAPFNPDARPGLGNAVSAEYEKWCDSHPNSTQNDRKAAYAMIHEKLRPKFPSYGEMRQDLNSRVQDGKSIWIPA